MKPVDKDEGLIWASIHGHVDIVKLLLANGANVHADGDCALRLASRNGYVAVVKILQECV